MRHRTAPIRVPPLAQDVLLAAFVAVMQVQGTVTRAASEPESVLRPLADVGHLGYVLLAASGVVLVVRRRFPVTVFVLTALSSATYYALDYSDGPGWLALFIATYTLTAHGDGRRSLRIAAVGIVLLTGCWLAAAADITPDIAIGWVFFRIGATVMSAALGESIRSRRVIAAEAIARAELAERTRDEEARARVDEERLRIAREVHDTVAHAIAIINVQSGVTAHVIDKRPDRAREALESIERTSSQALREMRTILGVLRDADDERAPYPGLGQVDELVAKGRDAGLDIKLEAAAPVSPLPSAVDSACYRILQESITNVIRHAGPTRVTIGLRYDAESVGLRVTNEAAAPERRPAAPSAGRGIQGMRERCQLLGGELTAGPVPSGGFEVTASLPFSPDAKARP
ncbi:sensor histidine kinase [Nocardioides speluncae]|uniref:sensor histidine kinase n=1 Tax=Nocardioides speluncae TaxID=2670337 RepID=UPI000D689D48|nr:sensor histidine kinase [Nocardioides speluncae]